MSGRNLRNLSVAGCALVAVGLSACQPARRVGPNRDASTSVGQITLHDGSKARFTLGEIGVEVPAARIWASSCPMDLRLSFFLQSPSFRDLALEGQEAAGPEAVKKAEAEAERLSKRPGGCAAMRQRIVADPTANKFLDPKRG